MKCYFLHLFLFWFVIEVKINTTIPNYEWILPHEVKTGRGEMDGDASGHLVK